jgi:RNA polymerase sigma-70 factor (TIGR02960 family)
VTGSVWLEPLPDEMPANQPGDGDPAASFLRREGAELAFVAALQHLPSSQHAVLILREVLQFSAAEVARILDITPASVNSALQRARKTVDRRMPATSQRAELDALGADGRRELVDAFVAAWERADVAAILDLLAEDARFTMPPLPAWFLGREHIGRFLEKRMFATPWRLPIGANGQLAFACYQGDPGGRFRLGAINLLRLRDGWVVEIAAFLDPGVHRHFGLPQELPNR